MSLNLKKFDEDLKERLDRTQPTLRYQNERQAYADLKNNLIDYNKVRDQVVALATSNQNKQATDLIYGGLVQSSSKVLKNIDDLVKFNFENGNMISEDLSASDNQTITTMVVLIVAIMLISILLGVFIARIISRPVNKYRGCRREDCQW